MAGVTIDLTDKTDFVTGTADADLFTAWMSKFSGSDTIRAGDGYDVLRILNGSATFGPAYFVNVTGIDELDLSNATGKIVLTVDDAMVEQSDAGVLRVRLGSARVDRLDSSGVTDPAGVILNGTGPITLIDGRDNRLSLGDAGGFVQGGTGRDRVAGGAGDDTIRGGEGGDALYGNRGRDILEGEAGDDRLEGGDGDDTLTGGAGDDVMVGGAGADRFVVGFADGHDRIEDFDAAQGDRLVLQGFTTIRSFADIATTQTATGVLLNLGGVGSVELVGRTASEVGSAVQIDGPSDAPVAAKLTGDADILSGGSGDDVFSAYTSAIGAGDVIKAGAGIDTLKILSGVYTLDTAKLPTIVGIDVLDVTAATTPKLTIDQSFVDQSDNGVLTILHKGTPYLNTSGVSDASDVVLVGGNGVTLADGADNRVTIGDGAGKVYGGSGNDTIVGGSGADMIVGGSGDDVLVGGRGGDTMRGGAGADLFVVEAGATSLLIEDFDANGTGERIDLSALGLSGMQDLEIRGDAAGATVVAGGLEIRLAGAAAGALRSDDFVFGSVDPGPVEPAPEPAPEPEAPAPAPAPAPVEPEPERDPVPQDPAVYAKLGSGTDNLTGGSGNDVFSAYTSAIGANDVIRAGTGIDTLKILSGTYTLDTAKLPTITGIDVLDVTAATTPKLTIDQGFVDQSDHGVLTILHKGTPYLNTSGVGDASDVVLVGGNGVTLADGADNRVTIGDGGGKVYGGSGNDTIVGGSGSDMMVGGGGDDILVGGRGGDTMRGGAGADLFVVEAGATSLLIEDFDTNSAVERIDLDALNLSGMQDLTIRGDSGGATVSGGGVQIRLAGVQADALAESDFVFGEDDRNPSVIRFEAGASVAEIQATIRHAAPGTVIELGAGEFRFDTTLYIDRPDIELRGAGSAQTKIVFDLDGGAEKHGIVVGDQIYAKAATSVTLKANAKAGASTVSVNDASGLKAGDFVYYSQANDQAFFDQQGYDKLTPAGTDPLREGLARIESISGSTLTLDRPLGFDLASGKATVTPIGLLEGIKIEGFQIAFTLGVADAYDFNNTKAAFESAGALKVQNTFRAEVSDIDVVQAPSNAIWFTRALELEANGLRTEGAHNKGGEGNGYGVILDEVTDSSIGNVTSLDMRHAVLFGAWNAELRNDIHVALTDRDINFHGGPDHGNTVVVDKSIADYTNKSWTIVSRGGELIHPPTDLTKNAVYFREAHAGSLNDFMRGHDDGSRLSGGGGNDTITGGSGRDVISGDLGSDLLAGGAGADRFVFTNGDGYDTILDFKASEGDVLELRNFAIDRIEDAGYRTSGSDLILDFGGSNGIVLKGLAGTSVGNLPVAIEASAEKGLSLASSPGTTMMMGSDADDTFSIYLTNVATDTRIIGGDGDDTLFFKSGSFTFDTRNYKGFQGIETIDLTGTTTPKLYVGTQMVDAADGDQLVLRVGSQGLERLETADMPSGLKVVVEGPGRVNLGPAGAEIELSQTGGHYVVGDKGNDFVRAGGGGDRIELGAGNDTIVGGRGNDTMAGGSGADRFVFAPGGGHDVIKDWNAVDDVIFEGYGAGATFTSKLVSGGLLLSLSDDQSILLSGITSKVLSPSDVDWI